MAGNHIIIMWLSYSYNFLAANISIETKSKPRFYQTKNQFNTLPFMFALEAKLEERTPGCSKRRPPIHSFT